MKLKIALGITFATLLLLSIWADKNYQTQLGAQTDEQKFLTQIQNTENNYLSTLGQYKHVPKTRYNGVKESFDYEVNEFLYPDGQRGYQVLITRYSTVTTATTTYQKEVLKSIGVGKEASFLTWTK